MLYSSYIGDENFVHNPNIPVITKKRRKYFYRTTISFIRGAIGIIWSVGMALGALHEPAAGLHVGRSLRLPVRQHRDRDRQRRRGPGRTDGLFIIAGALLWLRPVMYVAFDRDFARSQGIPTRVISYVMAALVAVTIVLSIRIMGIVLLISLVTIPVTIVNTFTKSFRTLAPAAAAVAVAGNLAGLAQATISKFRPEQL